MGCWLHSDGVPGVNTIGGCRSSLDKKANTCTIVVGE